MFVIHTWLGLDLGVVMAVAVELNTVGIVSDWPWKDRSFIPYKNILPFITLIDLKTTLIHSKLKKKNWNQYFMEDYFTL